MLGHFPTLRTFYYLEHFEEMIAFLELHCIHLMSEKEEAFIRDFRTLGHECRAMLVRLSNRGGSVFRIARLKYAELPNVPALLNELKVAGFIRRPARSDRAGIINVLKRSEIIALLRPLTCLSSKPKPELLKLITHDHPDLGEVGEAFVIQEKTETLEYLFFLYFGKLRKNLQTLALRDLGIVRTRSGQSSFDVRFPSREAASTAFFHAGMSERIEASDAKQLLELAADVPAWPLSTDPTGESVSDRVICRLGARIEQAGHSCVAYDVYRHASAHPARERMSRILFASGDTAGAERMLMEIVASPYSDEELLFAEDFLARKFCGRKIGRLTEVLRSAPSIRVDEAFRDGAEAAAVAYFRARGERAYRTENNLWAALFGLMFWDLLQGEDGAMRHNEFEHRPTQLTDGSFLPKNRKAIQRRLSLLHDGGALPFLESVIETHNGELNGVFRWARGLHSLVREIIIHGAPGAIESILLRIAANSGANGTGFPDLMVVDGDRLRFVEIKAEGDQIRRNQLVQLQALQRAGFAVEVVRVEWFADPDQEYVVVDVETTGGRAANHRITEIGAVKLQGGKVTGKFSTLLNPERRIPGNITRLTGISDAMVAGAPKFPEVARELRDFVGNAVLVAHNARFDYGFLREEFSRIGHDFRRTSLCTVVAMRKYFPGLKSYGLGALSAHFNIPLENHHRALCDAEATVELLKLINGKRLGGAGVPIESARP